MKNRAYQNFGLKIILSLLLMASSAMANSANSENTNTSKMQEAYLFVQSANKGIIKANPSQQNLYTLTLNKVKPFITYFAERPNRNAGVMPISQFLKLWDKTGVNNFKINPPNAVLNALHSGMTTTDDFLNVVVELMDPQYDSHTKTLTYTVKVLHSNVDRLPDSANLQHVTLFVDDACLSCW